MRNKEFIHEKTYKCGFSFCNWTFLHISAQRLGKHQGIIYHKTNPFLCLCETADKESFLPPDDKDVKGCDLLKMILLYYGVTFIT